MSLQMRLHMSADSCLVFISLVTVKTLPDLGTCHLIMDHGHGVGDGLVKSRDAECVATWPRRGEALLK